MTISRKKLLSLECLGVGHHWNLILMFTEDRPRSRLKGVPTRVCICSGCDSMREDKFDVHGNILSRRYLPSDSYTSLARKIGEPNERRKAYRAALAADLARNQRKAPRTS